ncbi:hypothetical protein DFH94DRAFT_66981 [Russula ochroleuca]|uniref:Uncharacterized protein n=1 Tax=Russula ochroleuca TaxID=152965 RepID=A0A9P5MU48_9AGAM|nr:hypothetical protein DFH94DRAFT_66981 [Russula ochroleuca]
MAVEPFLGTRAQRFFIATICIQAIAVLAIISIVFRMVAEHVDLTLTNYRTVPCYLALFVLAELFELLMAFDALRLRNVIQLVGILVFHVALVVFATIQIHETKVALVRTPNCDGTVSFVTCGGKGTLYRKVEHLLIAAPGIIAAAWIVLIFFVRALYYEFGWAVFRIVGANPAMKTMYQFYQVLICLLKFDFFAFTGVTIQLLIVVLSKNSTEFGLTIAAIPVVLVLLIGCGFAVQREVRSLMAFSLVLMLASETYFYKLYRFYDPNSEDQYETTRATLTVFTIVAILLLLTTFGVGLRCFTDFGKGLYESKTSDTLLRPKKIPHSDGEKPDSRGYPLQERLSIE